MRSRVRSVLSKRWMDFSFFSIHFRCHGSVCPGLMSGMSITATPRATTQIQTFTRPLMYLLSSQVSCGMFSRPMRLFGLRHCARSFFSSLLSLFIQSSPMANRAASSAMNPPNFGSVASFSRTSSLLYATTSAIRKGRSGK